MQSLHDAIKECVEKIGDPLMRQIITYCERWPEDQVRRQVRAMVQQGVLRMKEDYTDHDWTYRKGRYW